jgi:hypothetical protein
MMVSIRLPSHSSQATEGIPYQQKYQQFRHKQELGQQEVITPTLSHQKLLKV